ncbi:MAG: bifunctional precorrin-2 dehydrogenase/sirohydrochlorin ferrochelatase [Desulfobacterales bacterium]|nr:bifunctional precorrin-2 dehydrogenase/sirohydrochlorin ferrochelatase [Desulfobacterales bacterium]
MRYYPVNLDIRNRPCLVVGGGSVGARKVTNLLRAGAVVTVVSPEAEPRIEALAEKGAVSLEKRSYRSSDLQGVFLVIGATDDEALNLKISADARRANMLCNIADQPEKCNFILPAIIQRGDLIIAISTSGKSPAFAKKLREELQTRFGEEYAEFLNLMGAARKKLLSRAHAPEAHKPLFEKLIDGDLVGLIREGKTDEINALLRQVLGRGFDLDSLRRI